jgi:hypothetical protein
MDAAKSGDFSFRKQLHINSTIGQRRTYRPAQMIRERVGQIWQRRDHHRVRKLPHQFKNGQYRAHYLTMKNGDRTFVSKSEAVRRLSCDRRTIYLAIRAGRIITNEQGKILREPFEQYMATLAAISKEPE